MATALEGNIWVKIDLTSGKLFANLMKLRWGGIRWTPTAFYLNIPRTIENRVKFFCISSGIQYVTKIH